MRTIKKSTQLALADAIRAKSGSAKTMTTEDMVTAIEGLNVTNVSYPLADVPTTMGQRAALARAAQMRDIQWTLRGDLTMTGGSVYPAGKVVTGLPYSSVRKTDRFIGYNISLHTFLTAVHNPRSLLYTTTAEENTADNGNIANLYYGVNCSVFGSYAHDWHYHSATNAIPELPYITEIDPADMQLCDLPVASTAHGGSVGHVVMITGIARNADGTINTLEITESTYPIAKASTMTYADFVATYIEGQGYRVYRDTRLHKTAYEPSPYVQVFDDEDAEEAIYSDLCTNRGDKVTITTDEDIVLNVLISNGYESIKVYCNGALYGTYTVSAGTIVDGDLALSGLPAGMYTAVLCDSDDNALDNGSTSWEVCAVAVSRSGNRFTFEGTGIPVRIVYKNSGGYTLTVFDLTEDDVARGYKDITDWTGSTPAEVCVPFRGAYGFAVARSDYDAEAEALLPEEYQQIEYVETTGYQYIDTGVLASDHPNGIIYDMYGSVTGRAGSGKVDYFWGATDGTNRSGYIGMPNGAGTDTANINLFVGTSSSVIKSGTITFGADHHICVKAGAATASTATAYLDGTALASPSTGVDGTQPAKAIWLFACNGISDTTGNRRFMGRCTQFTMTAADGTPIRNFVPCYRVSDGVIGLYDTVEGKFYTNAGTGAFTKGADV